MLKIKKKTASMGAAPNDLPSEDPAGIFSHNESEIKAKKAGRNWRKIVTIAAIVLLNTALLAGSGYFYKKTSAIKLVSKPSVAAAPAATPDPTPKVTQSSPDSKLLHYTSKPLKVEFDYPVDWRIQSSADNKWASLTSPDFDFTDSTGKADRGKISMRIESDPNYFGFIADSDTATIASQKLTYANPVSGQRKDTYVSFASYEDSATGFQFAFVSGNLFYNKGAQLNTKNYVSINPHVSLYVDNCHQGCQALSAASIDLKTWQTEPEMLKAQDLIKSLRINQ
jgi:hypothetical protein